MSEDFIKALWESQDLPDLPESVAKQIPDLLAGEAGQQRLVRKAGLDEANKIPGAKTFEFEFQCARLMIGNQIIDTQNGKDITEEIDDGGRLKEIMDKSLRGESIINKRETTFLKDGTVVVWIEWMEPKKAPPRSDREYMTMDELLDPEPSKKPSDIEDSGTDSEAESSSSEDLDSPFQKTDEQDNLDSDT